MTKGKPVVWLTTGGDEWWERSGHGEPVRIVVRLPTNSRPPAHYAKWLRRHFGAAEAPGWILTCDDFQAPLLPPETQVETYLGDDKGEHDADEHRQIAVAGPVIHHVGMS